MPTRNDICITEMVLDFIARETPDPLLYQAITRVERALYDYVKYRLLLRRDDEASP